MGQEKKEKGITRRDFVKSVGVAAAAGSVISASLPKSAHAARNLKIGFMGPFTGPASRTGDAFKRGIEMALEDARAAGEIPVNVDGKTMDIEPVWVDSQSSPEKSVKAVTDAVNRRGVKMMVTGWHSSVAMACMDAESPLKIVHIGHQGESQYINFKINDHPEKYQGWFKGWASPPVFAGLYGFPLRYFIEKGLWKPYNRKAAVIVEDTDYGRGWGEALVVSLRTAGFDVKKRYDVNAIDQTEFTPIITKYKAAGVSVVATTQTGGVPMYNFVKQFRAMGIRALLLAHGLTWTGEWYENTGEASDYAICMDSPYPISPEQKKWMERFKDKYGVEAGIAPSGQPYDHTRLAIKVLNEAGTLKFEKLLEHVREKVKYKGVWQLYDFATYNDFWKDFSEEGTLHQLSRNDVRTGDFMKGFFFPMVQMFGGKPKILWPLDLADAQFKAPPWI